MTVIGEPPMRQALGGSASLQWIGVEQMSQKVAKIVREPGGELVLGVDDSFEQIHNRDIVKGQEASAHRIEHAAAGPEIGGAAIVAVTRTILAQDLSGVTATATSQKDL